jgi:hypothetical protein
VEILRLLGSHLRSIAHVEESGCSGRGSSRLHPASDEYVVDAVLHSDAYLSILSIVVSHADVVDYLASVDLDFLVHRAQILDEGIDVRLGHARDLQVVHMESDSQLMSRSSDLLWEHTSYGLSANP